MKFLIAALASSLTISAGPQLSTQYAKDRPLRIEVETSFSLETTDFSVERDGEPVDIPDRGGMSTSEERRVVQIDRVVEQSDARPSRVRRTFEEIAATTMMAFGEEERESERDCPLAGVTLEIALDENDDKSVEVVEGESPDDEALLEGHGLELALDALLPSEEMEIDDSWELDADAIRHALGLDMTRALFPTPAREDAEGGGEGGRRRRGAGFGRGGSGRLLQQAEWEGTAKLVSLSEKHEDMTCARIVLEISASGELPEAEPGGGGRRQRALAPDPPSSSSPGSALENSFEIELEGELLFALEGRRPVHMEIEGSISMESRRERSRGDVQMVISTSQEGSFSQVVSISEEEPN